MAMQAREEVGKEEGLSGVGTVSSVSHVLSFASFLSVASSFLSSAVVASGLARGEPGTNGSELTFLISPVRRLAWIFDSGPLSRHLGTSENGVAHMMDLGLHEALDLHCRGMLVGTPVLVQSPRRRVLPRLVRPEAGVLPLPPPIPIPSSPVPSVPSLPVPSSSPPALEESDDEESTASDRDDDGDDNLDDTAQHPHYPYLHPYLPYDAWV